MKLNIDITKQPNLVGIHVIFEDGTKKVVGEIESANKETLKVIILLLHYFQLFVKHYLA